MNKNILFALAAMMLTVSCKKDQPESLVTNPQDSGPKLIFKFAFNPNQERLNSLGIPSTVPTGRAAQSPSFNKISAHYIELTPTIWTQVGQGELIYNGPSTSAGGNNAIDFSQAIIVGEGENFLSYPISAIEPGSYAYIRVSLSYQNYNIAYRANSLDLTGTLASFIGFNNYIGSYIINTQSVAVNDDKLQGYWGFETEVFGTSYIATGQTPPGATTVPNPLSSTSPIPAGSCLVTGSFNTPFIITGNETEDIVLTLSLSTNNSFEWSEITADGKYEPSIGENVVDMGIRGLIPIVD